MKKLILIAVAFISLQAVAQDGKRGDSKEKRHDRREMMKDLSAEDIATLGSKKMTLALDLTSTQQTQVKAVLLEQAKDRKEKMAEHEKMKSDDNAKKPSKEDRVKIMNEKLDAQIAMKQKMKTILNAEQYEKWSKMQGRRNLKSKGKRGRKANK